MKQNHNSEWGGGGSLKFWNRKEEVVSFKNPHIQSLHELILYFNILIYVKKKHYYCNYYHIYL